MGIVIEIGKCKERLPAIIELAKLVYEPADVSSYQKYLQLFEKNPTGFIVAHDDFTGQVVGYIISVVLKSDYFKTTLSPDYKEEDLTPFVVLPYSKGVNRIYFFSIVTHPSNPHRLAILTKLTLAFREQLRAFAIQGVYVTEASALALSKSGIKICEGMSMVNIGVNERGPCFTINPSIKCMLTTLRKRMPLELLLRIEERRRIKE